LERGGLRRGRRVRGFGFALDLLERCEGAVKGAAGTRSAMLEAGKRLVTARQDFARTKAAEGPLAANQFIDKSALFGNDGMEAGVVFVGDGLEGSAFFGGKRLGFGGDAGFQGVDAGFLGFATVCVDLERGRHGGSP
jgi:hypothetical protein